MKKLKPYLFASCLLGLVTLAKPVAANDQGYATFSKTAYNTTTKTFDVIAKKSPNGKNIKQVDVAIWSEENGQDDIKWYSTSNVVDGQAKVQFNLANHGSRAGDYNTHVYVTYSDGVRKGSVLARTKVNVKAPQISLNNADIHLYSDVNAPSNGVIYYAVWSEENGQDDIKWYPASQTGLTVANLKNHKSYGSYQIHTYLQQNGKMTGISTQSISVNKPSISHQIIATSDKTYDIIVNNVPDYFSSIKIPIWSDVNGQDDIKWYQASKISPNTYKVNLQLTNHGFDFGKYNVHIYGQNDVLSKFEGLAVTAGFNVSSISGLENPLVTLDKQNIEEGTFTVSALETAMSKKITKMNVSVKSKSNPNLSKTYEAKTSSYGKIYQSVDLKQLVKTADTFVVDATVTYSDNTSIQFILPEASYRPKAQTQATASAQTSQTAGTPKITTYINEQNTYPVGQCTWAVKSLAPWIPNFLGNANSWATGAKSKGFRVGTSPRVGSIIVWPNDGGGYGHVAYVTHVESSTKIQVKESNYAGNKYISNFRGWFNPLDSSWGGNVSYIYPD